MTSSDLLDPTSITAALADLAPDWTGSPAGLHRSIRFADAPTAVRFISDLSAISEERDHHADLALSYDTVEVTLVTHSADGVTRKDVELGADVDRVAAALPLFGDNAGDDSGDSAGDDASEGDGDAGDSAGDVNVSDNDASEDAEGSDGDERSGDTDGTGDSGDSHRGR